MGISKVDYFGETLIDLTADTVTADTLAEGVTAHSADGEVITGRMQPGGDGEPIRVYEDEDGNVVVSGGGSSYDDTAIRNRVSALELDVLGISAAADALSEVVGIDY